jgi:predicted enzyme related to lactoylglutathione lyase
MKLVRPFVLVAAALALPLVLHSCAESVAAGSQTQGYAAREPAKEPSLSVDYLEFVSSDVDATCKALSKVHGITFGEPIVPLGNARLAALAGGGQIGVRAPMSEQETPVVRAYASVDDIETAIEAAEAAGAVFAMKATEIPGQNAKFAIYFLGGNQHGIWERGEEPEAKEQ